MTSAHRLDYHDQNNEIGKDGANMITNVAGQGTNGYGIYASYQNNIKVANNIVTSTMGGTGSPSIYGIFLTNGPNSNVDLYNNTVTINYSGSGTANLYTMWCDMGGLGQFNTVNIYNNMVTGCTYSTLTTGTVRFMNFNNLGITGNVYGNTVSNNTIGSSGATATGTVYYLACNKSSPNYGPVSVYNNTVTGNTRMQSVPGSATTYFINVIGSASIARVYNNTVTNNVISSIGSAYGISVIPSIASNKIYDNTVTGMTQANGTFYGINFSSSSRLYQQRDLPEQGPEHPGGPCRKYNPWNLHLQCRIQAAFRISIIILWVISGPLPDFPQPTPDLPGSTYREPILWEFTITRYFLMPLHQRPSSIRLHSFRSPR